MRLALYIFIRDHRIQDNLSLYNYARTLEAGTKIMCVFILNPEQVRIHSKNKNYFSESALQFMCESLIDLNRQLKSRLCIFYGDPVDVLVDLLEKFPEISSVGFHRDFSQFALVREKKMRNLFERVGLDVFVEENDMTLLPLEELCRQPLQGFKQYGAFYRHAQKNASKIACVRNNGLLFYKPTKKKVARLKYVWDHKMLNELYNCNDSLAQRGGRKEGLLRLKNVSRKKFGDYALMRDRLDYNTTEISGYLNFGCLSVREVYLHIRKYLGSNSQLLKQLWWRDFYLQAAIFLPHGNEFEYMDERYEQIKWHNKKADWNKIMNAQTGFLIVDAAMRQMMQTGYMHNRARMIVGVFWTKYCLIDTFHPAYGSQTGFSRYLLDAVGISQNKMNHHWITEFDFPGKKYAPKGVSVAGRPMDVSNKIISKFDPEGTYIRTWIPELNSVSTHDLARWDVNTYNKYMLHVPPMFNDPKEKYTEWVDACRGL